MFKMGLRTAQDYASQHRASVGTALQSIPRFSPHRALVHTVLQSTPRFSPHRASVHTAL